MDASNDGLRQVPQRPRRRRPVRRLDQPGCTGLWELQRLDGLGRDVQPGLSELFENVVGGAGERSRIYSLIMSLTFRGRSRLTSKRAAGYSGRGRQSRRMNGRIPLASSMGGSRRTPLTASTPISAIDAYMPRSHQILSSFTTLMTTNALSPQIFSYASFMDVLLYQRLAVGQ
jgi:hypothetical protein